MITTTAGIRIATVTAGLLTTGLLAVPGPALAGPPTRAVAPASAISTTAIDPEDALLSAAQMPRVNQVQRWIKIPSRGDRVSNAQPGPISELGARDKARRDFEMPGGQATNTVLTFRNRAAAKAAYREVRTWRTHTGDNVPAGGELLFTSKHKRVEVETGRGTFFSFTFKNERTSEVGTFEWLGITRRGSAISLVMWRINGQDANFDTDPTIVSVRYANRELADRG